MRMLTGIATGVITAAMLTLGSAGAAAAAPDDTAVTDEAVVTPDVGTKDVERKKFDCKTPKGKKLSVSWGTGTNISTTIYFNNHCNQKRTIQTWVDGAGLPEPVKSKCLTVNPKTKGDKKFSTFGRTVVKVTSPKKC
ncbi:hypothetical protein [Nonomuraea sp. B5E05]|uniref:hypothetical protein n=1 Tax=Nonomuraea sp. B5E05 TaxID=3153569 RepID=UPI0032604DCD